MSEEKAIRLDECLYLVCKLATDYDWLRSTLRYSFESMADYKRLGGG